MIYTALTNKAMKLAYTAHHGQTDTGGLPYIFHPFHLAEQMTDEITVCVALLHDVVEDTPVTLDRYAAGMCSTFRRTPDGALIFRSTGGARNQLMGSGVKRLVV